MKLKNVFKKIIATIEVAAMTLALMAGLSIANTTEVLAAGTLTLNEATEIVSDSEEVFTFIAPEDGTYYFYSVTAGDCDPYAYLETETEEYEDDDNKGLDFWIEAELSEGEECELTVSAYDIDEGYEYETIIYVRDEATAQETVYEITSGGDKFVTEGESYELAVELLNLVGDTIDTIPEGYSIKWFMGNEFYMETELEETSATYSIDEITDEDLCIEETDYAYYIARLYEGEEEIDAAYFYLYDIEKTVSLSAGDEYADAGETIKLTVTAYDHNYDEINLAEKTDYTYKWYKATEDEYGDLENYEEIADATGYSYNAKITASDFYEESNDYVCYVCELYINGEKIDNAKFYINDKDKYIDVYGDIYYVSEGDKITLQPEIYDYDGNEIDINDENLEYEWYSYDENYDEKDLGNTPTLEVDSVSFVDGEATYHVEITYKGVGYGYASFYVYDAYTAYYGGYDEVVANIGESITLEAKVTDYNDNMLTDFDDSFTFEWYKVTYDEDLDEDVYGDVLGTGITYKIESVEESDICSEDTDYVKYVCVVYRDGNRITTYDAEIIEPTAYWKVESPEDIYAKVGEKVTFKPVIVGADGNEIDINDDRFTYEWFDPDFEMIGSDSTYTINSVTEKDFCDEDLFESYEVFIYDSVSKRSNWISFYLYRGSDSVIPPTEPQTTEGPTTGVNEPTTVAPTTATPEKVTKPAKAKIKKVTPKKKSAKKVKISLKKIKGATGYQVAIYKTKKNAKKNKKALVKKIVKKTKVTIKSKKLKNKKKLFVKARAYALDGKKKVWGKWSKIKKVKIKK